MRILMADASGFLGTRLTHRLAADGHEIVSLVRRAPRVAGEVRWTPPRPAKVRASVLGADGI